MELTVRIEKLVHRGLGLGRLPDGRAVFVPYSCPGEEVLIRLTREQRSWVSAELVEVRTPAAERREPPCPYFGRCGGCQLMHLEYPAQREWKRRIAEEVWRGEAAVRLGSRHAEEFDYRRRVRLHVLPGNRGLGFMGQYTNTIVDIADCLVCAPSIRQAFPWVRQDLLPRLTAEGVELETVTIIVGDEPPPVLRLQPRRPVPRVLRRAVADRADFPLEWAGEGTVPRAVTLTVGGLACSVDAATFFQAHPAAVAEAMADPALELSPAAAMLELYCGSGLFSLHFARRVREVVAVEGDPGCRRLFAGNMQRHRIANARLEAVATESWLARHAGELGNFDTLFVDPPRTGLTPPVRKTLAQAPFALRLYLSCDVATQQRDLSAWLAAGRCRLDGLTVFDFFPNTFHIECLARLHGTD